MPYSSTMIPVLFFRKSSYISTFTNIVRMMKMFKSIAVILLAGAVFNLTSCGGSSDPGPSAQDAQLTKLSKTWNETNVTQPGTSDYSNLKIVISSTAGQTTFNYTATGRPSGTKAGVWGPSGTFTFGSNFSTTLTRDDGTVITYAVSDSQLQMSFTYSGAGYDGRVGVIAGAYVFTFGL